MELLGSLGSNSTSSAILGRGHFQGTVWLGVLSIPFP